MGFLVMRSTNKKMENLKEKLKTNTKWKSQLIIFYSLRDICNIPRIFLNKLWTLFVADFQHFFSQRAKCKLFVLMVNAQKTGKPDKQIKCIAGT